MQPPMLLTCSGILNPKPYTQCCLPVSGTLNPKPNVAYLFPEALGKEVSGSPGLGIGPLDLAGFGVLGIWGGAGI